MATLFSTTADYLTRNNSIPNWTNPAEFDNGAAFSLWFKLQTVPTGSQYIALWLFGDPNLVHPYLRVYITVDGLLMTLWDGTTLKTSVTAAEIFPLDRWSYLYTAYTKASSQLRPAFIDRFLPSLSGVHLDTIPWVEQQEWLGADNSGSANRVAGVVVATTRTTYRGFPPFQGGQNVSDFHAQFDEVGINNQYKAGTVPHLVDFFQSSVGLSSPTDLSDTTTHGNIWVVHGTPTSSSGPLALGLFSDNFNDATFSPWTLNPNNKNAVAVGVDRTNAFACADAEVRRFFEQPYPTDGTINFYHGINAPLLSPTAELSSGILVAYGPNRSFYDTFLGNSISTSLVLSGNGTIILSIAFTTSGNVRFLSAPGVFVFDGTPYGIQFTWKLTGTSLTVDVYVNGVLVVTGTATIASLVFPYYNFVLLQSILNGNESNPLWSVSENFQLVHTYNGLTPPLNPTNMEKLLPTPCAINPIPPSDVSSGIYKVVPNKRNDTIYKTHSPVTTQDFKIPDPLAITFLAGDDNG